MTKEIKPTTQVAVAPIVEPAVTPIQALKSWENYQELKKKIIEPTDKQKIGNNIYLKKSYWRKIQKFFNLQLKCIKEERIKKDKKGEQENIAYSSIYRAIAHNGAFCDGDGFCESWEKGRFNCEHNVRATAHTRAKNRAISDLVGGGEISAEEINGNGISEAKKIEYVDLPKSKTNLASADLKCAECGIIVSQRVADVSSQNFNRILCYPTCQGKEKERREQAEIDKGIKK